MSVPCCLRRQQGGYSRRKCLTWQEQYDLGMKFLSDGNYEEAIIAFIAAIEIDPKQVDAYIRLAEIYTAQGDTEKAVEILNQALESVGENETILDAIDQITSSDSSSHSHQESSHLSLPERIDYEDGSYMLCEYNELGNITRGTYYNADGAIITILDHIYDESGHILSMRQTDPDGGYAEYAYDHLTRNIRYEYHFPEEMDEWFFYEYEQETVTVTYRIDRSGDPPFGGTTVYTMSDKNNSVDLCSIGSDRTAVVIEYTPDRTEIARTDVLLQ